MRLVLPLCTLFLLWQSAQGQSWQPTGEILNSGRYDDVEFVTPDLGWTGGGSGKIYKTENGGDTWEEVFSNPILFFRSLAFLNEQVGFAGTLNGLLMRTTDGGTSWEEIQNAIPGPVDGICGLDHVGDHLFGVGVWSKPSFFIHSSDQGNTWTYQDLSEYADALVECRFLTPDIGWVSGTKENAGGVILKTTDGGQNWELVHETNMGLEYVWKIDIVNDTILYASIESFDEATSILKSIDGGDNWVELPVSPLGFDVQGIGFRDEWHGWVSPRYEPLFETQDGGVTWQQLSAMPGMNRFFRIDQDLIYASGRGGVFRFDGMNTSIQEFQEEPPMHAILELSPNPAVQELLVRIRLDVTTMVCMDILSTITGQVSPCIRTRMDAGQHTLAIPSEVMSGLPSGPYLITLRTNEGFTSSPWIKY
ncbi:MAG: hypothetical protein K9I85_08800 [Saprospiraceae bacterium]|nr:hypothetical protein [Saprospiraceae bacterium]